MGADAVWHVSLKHLLHMFPVAGLPKKPQPLAHEMGPEDSAWSLTGVELSELAMMESGVSA